MPRFVVLYHAMPTGAERPSHWDWMFECGDKLRTWALREELETARTGPVELLADHRLAYLDYEGPVSGGRGAVHRVDRGEYDLLADAPDEFIVTLRGARYRGRLRLARTSPTEWSATFAPPGAAPSNGQRH